MKRKRMRNGRFAKGFQPSRTLRNAEGMPIGGSGSTGATNDELDFETTETLELAGVRAEEAVHPHLVAARSRDRLLHGMSTVALTFLDTETYASFSRLGAIVRHPDAVDWLLVRRWESANGDAELDEVMSQAVARHLNAELGHCLRAYVMTFID